MNNIHKFLLNKLKGCIKLYTKVHGRKPDDGQVNKWKERLGLPDYLFSDTWVWYLKGFSLENI